MVDGSKKIGNTEMLVQTHGGVKVMAFKGRIDSETLPYFEKDAHNEIKGFLNVVMDLSEVPYLDSTGLSFLIRLNSEKKSTGSPLVLRNTPPHIRQLLRLTRMEQYFNME